MPEENKNPNYLHFDRMLREAYRDFLDYEDSRLQTNRQPAVRAARFNQYISTYYPILKEAVTPDICETYIERFNYMVEPLGEIPDEPLNDAQRLAESISAYRQFKKDVAFSGSKDAEVLAFRDYVSMKYANTLPDFSEEESQAAISGFSAKRKSSYLKYLMGTVCAVVLAGVIIPAARQEDTFPEHPNTPTNRRSDDRYKPRYPLISPGDAPVVLPPGMYPQPYFNPTYPSIGPVTGQPGADALQQWQPDSWQERYNKNNERDGKDGTDSQRKR